MINKLLDEPYWDEMQDALSNFIDLIFKRRTRPFNVTKAHPLETSHQMIAFYYVSFLEGKIDPFYYIDFITEDDLVKFQRKVTLDLSEFKKSLIKRCSNRHLTREEKKYMERETNIHELLGFVLKKRASC